ncbi:MAG: DUF1015 domain-containing protein [Candidatus Hydrogenedentota bacterium]|nr:MAG: DUF1015 domain-containing protein [Candidatus Hydrogenedentota bacterium]
MAKISPFKGYRPRQDLVEQMVAPPYDIVDTKEAARLAEGNPYSFLHVSRSEIDLPEGTSLYDESVYEKARENFQAMLEKGWLEQDPVPSLYLYELEVNGRAQTGVVAGASAMEYEAGRIKKHELTRADKEEDRTKHTEYLGAHTGPVFLVYRHRDSIKDLARRVKETPPVFDVTTYDGVRNRLWVIERPGEWVEEFSAVPELYIADGHHRAASYTRSCIRARNKREHVTGEEPFNFFLAVLFPDDELKILPYNRIVKDFNGLSEEEFLTEVSKNFIVLDDRNPTPGEVHRIAMYFRNRWWTLVPRKSTYDERDPVGRLDTSILQENLLAPVLGIEDPRRSDRIDFVGGIRGTGELERRVREGGGVAFSLFPVQVADLMEIADAGRIMPPKSTWFEPKLKDGFVIKVISDSNSGPESS